MVFQFYFDYLSSYKLTKFSLYLGLVLILLMISYLVFCKTLIGVNSQSVVYYHVLQQQLKEKGYAPRFWIVSTVRPQWFNDILVSLAGGAAPKSRHIVGDAIDIVVMDVNKDGAANYEDVRIVKDILAQEVIGKQGGIGTYPHAYDFVSRQMVHFDCRGYAARWER